MAIAIPNSGNLHRDRSPSLHDSIWLSNEPYRAARSTGCRRGLHKATAGGLCYYLRATKNQEAFMKFFLDTANLEEIRKAAALGLADGVTTNPTLISKEGDVDFKDHIAEICKIVSGPVSAEVTSTNKDEMLREGREYVKIAPNVVIKCPLTVDGLE